MQIHRSLKVLASIAIVFGILTIFSGGRAIFGSEETRASAGNVVGFVVWFNFLAGLGYSLTGVGLWLHQRWATWASVVLALSTAMVALAFGLHVMGGGSYEIRTVGALVFRLGFWLFVAWFALRARDVTKVTTRT